MAEQSIRLHVKSGWKPLTQLTFAQEHMLKIGTVGVSSVQSRLRRAIGPNDGPAKPLGKAYAIKKTKLGLGRE